jgi:hypothetical protein
MLGVTNGSVYFVPNGQVHVPSLKAFVDRTMEKL